MSCTLHVLQLKRVLFGFYRVDPAGENYDILADLIIDLLVMLFSHDFVSHIKETIS